VKLTCADKVSVLLVQFVQLNVILDVLAAQVEVVKARYSCRDGAWEVSYAMEEEAIDRHANEDTEHET
jgi:hypothetical protein